MSSAPTACSRARLIAGFPASGRTACDLFPTHSHLAGSMSHPLASTTFLTSISNRFDCMTAYESTPTRFVCSTPLPSAPNEVSSKRLSLPLDLKSLSLEQVPAEALKAPTTPSRDFGVLLPQSTHHLRSDPMDPFHSGRVLQSPSIYEV